MMQRPRLFHRHYRVPVSIGARSLSLPLQICFTHTVEGSQQGIFVLLYPLLGREAESFGVVTSSVLRTNGRMRALALA